MEETFCLYLRRRAHLNEDNNVKSVKFQVEAIGLRVCMHCAMQQLRHEKWKDLIYLDQNNLKVSFD